MENGCKKNYRRSRRHFEMKKSSEKEKEEIEQVADKIMMEAKKLNIPFIHGDEEMKKKLVDILSTSKLNSKIK